MKKNIFLFALLCFSVLAFADNYSVNKGELEAAVSNPDVIEFKNYTGPHKVINTKAQIQGIGESLGIVIASDRTSKTQTGSKYKYQIIHAIGPEKNGLDADILKLGKDAGVDHIKNLRLIISSYLVSAYDYSEKDASTLATFITVYNAVYRNRLAELKNKYKPVVIENLTEKNAGLSVNYEDWPGKTEIIIPLLNAADGGISTIDTTSISDSNVISSMREDDNRGVDERRNMVDLKERESEAAYEQAQSAQKEAVETQKQADTAKKDAAAAEKKAEDDRRALVNARNEEKVKAEEYDKALKEAEENPEDEEKQQEAEEKEQELAEAEEKRQEAEEKAEESQKEAEEKRREAEQKQAEADAKSQEASEKQSFSDKKYSETVSERSAIAGDQQKNIAENAQLAKIETTYGLVISDEKEMLSTLVYVDVSNGQLVKESPVAYIRNRNIIQSNDGFVAVAGTTTGKNTAVKLVLIDKESMEIIAESVETLSPDTVLVESNGFYYVVISKDNKYYAAKYDSQLRLVQKSDIPVKKFSPIIVVDDNVTVTGEDGSAELLKF